MKKKENNAGKHKGEQHGNKFMGIASIKNGQQTEETCSKEKTCSGKRRKKTENQNDLYDDLAIAHQGKLKRRPFLEERSHCKEGRAYAKTAGDEQRKFLVSFRILPGNGKNR